MVIVASESVCGVNGGRPPAACDANGGGTDPGSGGFGGPAVITGRRAVGRTGIGVRPGVDVDVWKFVPLLRTLGTTAALGAKAAAGFVVGCMVK